MKVTVTCKCGKEFQTTEARIKAGRGKSCSKECHYKYVDLSKPRKEYVYTTPNPGWFEKGIIPWSKLHPELCKPNSGSIQKGERRGIDTEFKSLPNGEDTYGSIHSWVHRMKGVAKECENCGSTEGIQWANKSHEYKKETDDYIELCRKCHRDYDKLHYGASTKRFKKKVI